MKRWQILLICCFVLIWPMMLSHADNDLVIRVVSIINPNYEPQVTLEAIDSAPVIPDTVGAGGVTPADVPGPVMVPEAAEEASVAVVADEDAVAAIARMVWWEARGEPDEGQQAVAQVIMNRVRSGKFASTVVGVLAQRNQFSPWGNSDYHNVEVDERCYENTRIALSGGGPLSGDVYFFKAARLERSWKNLVEIVTIGNHRFYKHP